MELRPGMIVGGKYRLERALGQGGMGRLWVARHAQLGSTLAVKFLAPKFAASPVYRVRFEREARSAASIKCPQVVHVQDYGFEGDTPYFVMELLEGEDLRRRLDGGRRLPLDEAARILGHTAKALRKAHEAGIVHRDVKPANLFLARVGEEEIVKVLDFGIAKEIAAGPGETTSSGELMGSPHYMSPEQIAAARDIDARADLWSLAVILFRMLTGKLPFPGNQMAAVIAKILSEPAPRPSELAPDLPPALDGFFLRALARDRGQRFQSIGELEEAFRAAIGPTEAPRISVTLSPALADPSLTSPQPGAAPEPPNKGLAARHKSLVLAIVALVFLLGVATGVLFFRRSPSAEPEPGAAPPSSSTATPEAAPSAASKTAALPEHTGTPRLEEGPAPPEPSVAVPPREVELPPPSAEAAPREVELPPPSVAPAPSSGAPAPKRSGSPRDKPAPSAIPMRDKWF